MNYNLMSQFDRGKPTSQTHFKSTAGAGPNTPSSPSLDKHSEQLRQRETEEIKRERELKKFLKSHGMLYGDSIEGTKFYFQDEWEDLLESYENWRESMENCFLILRNKAGTDPSRQSVDQFMRTKKGIVSRCQTRFSPGKRKITNWRMDQFADKMKHGGNRFGLEVTLTTDPKRFHDLREVGDKWKFFIEKFMDFANQRLRRAGKKGHYCYLRACELTESGLLHIHIGFFGPGITGKIVKKYQDGKEIRDYVFPQEDIVKLWKKYGIGEIAWIAKKPVTDTTDYITKHVAKTWGRCDVNEMLEAFLHYTNMRQWSSSRGAVPKPPPALERWELVAFCIGEEWAGNMREVLLDEERELIQDDLKNLKPVVAG